MWTVQASPLLLLFAAAVVHAAKELPSWVVPCYRDDPGFNACALKHGREALPTLVKGDRKFRVPSLDPLEVTELRVDKAATKIGMDLTMRDVKLYGFTQSDLRDYRVDFEKKHISFINFVPVLNLICTYEVSGKILILPISGNGPANFTLINTLSFYDVEYDLVKKKNGKEHLVLKNGKLEFNSTKAHIHLDNLFGGNKLLGDSMNTFLEDNWEEMVREIGPAIGSAIEMAVKQVFSRIITMFTLDELHPLKPK